MTTTLKRKMKSVGELSYVCFQIVLKCLYLARFVRLDIPWSVNKFARSITKRTNACDKRLNRLISYIHHTCEYKQYCYVANTSKQCRLGLFQDSDFAGDLEDSKSTSGVHFSEAMPLFQSVGCVRKKIQFHTVQQNQKSLLSLDWDWTEFSLSICRFWLFLSLETIQIPDRSGHPVVKGDTDHGPSKRSQWMMNLLSKIDCVPSHPILHQEALLYVFEDNEAVIKVITKGRSLTMRHVSRTHRVAVDWLLDRINLDQKSKSSTSTTNQFADMLTKGNFTRDEWSHLLCLFNISHFSSTVCSGVMSKRTQQEAVEERVTAKSRSMMSLIARAPQLCHLRCQKARRRKAMEVRVFGVLMLRKMIERGNPLSTVTQVMSRCSTTDNLLKARTQHATQGGTKRKLGQSWWIDGLQNGEIRCRLLCKDTSSN